MDRIDKKILEILQSDSQISNHELNTLMVKKLDERLELLNCDEVMLEHQPSKNPRMKNLSFMLYSYFIIREFVDKTNIIMSNPRIYGKLYKCGLCTTEWK